MDAQKIGAFIKELRTEKNMTQEDLAQLIPIGREAISKWERGKNKPNKSCLEILSKIFGVSAEELLLGRRLKDNKEKTSFVLNLYEDRNNKQKLLHIFFILIIIILLVFLGYYFINTFNTIKVYTINYTDNNITLSNGIFISTKEKMYFRLGDIKTTKEIKSLRLYYKDKNDKDNLICETDNLNIMLYDYYGYNAYFNYHNITNILENLYLEISYKNEIHTIKLDLKKDFANNKLFNTINKKSTEPNLYYSKIDRVKLKSIFKKENDNYILKKDNYIFIFIEEADLLNLTIKNNNIIEEWYYYLNGDLLDYREYRNDKLINYFVYDKDKFNCKKGDCLNSYSKKDFFLNEIKEFL